MFVQPLGYSNYNNYNVYNKSRTNFCAKGVNKLTNVVSKYDKYTFKELFDEATKEFTQTSKITPEIKNKGKVFQPRYWSLNIRTSIKYKGKNYILEYTPAEALEESNVFPSFTILTGKKNERYNINLEKKTNNIYYTISHYPGDGTKYVNCVGNLTIKGEADINKYTNLVKGILKTFLEQ